MKIFHKFILTIYNVLNQKMNQLIKLDNKNSNQKNRQNAIKITFKNSILNYIQRKKNQLKGFSNLDQKLKHFQDIPIIPQSNLINKNTDINFQKTIKKSEQKNEQNINQHTFLSQKPKSFLLKNKIKCHKSSLSDWRNLYDQRDQIIIKNKRSNIFSNKMAATDRLFYPAKKLTVPNFQNQQIKRASSRRLNQSHSKKTSMNIESKNQHQREKSELRFLSDQNFYHLLHRSKTPLLFSDEVQNKRIRKYLKENKHLRHEDLYGLQQMNESFFNIKQRNADGLINQNVSLLDKRFENDSITVNKIKAQNTNTEKEQFQLDNQFQRNYFKQRIVNPQKNQVRIGKYNQTKKPKNLSEILCFDLNKQQREINLKLFKPRKNKVQKAISSLKPNHSQQTFSKRKFSSKKYSFRQTSTNWKKQSDNINQ